MCQIFRLGSLNPKVWLDTCQNSADESGDPRRRTGPTPYYHVNGASYNCIECGNKIIFLLDNPVITHICSAGPSGVDDIQNELIQKAGVCQQCYAEKYNNPEGEADTLRMIKQESVCWRNVNSIQCENFTQPDATKKTYKYTRMAEQLSEQLRGRKAFQEVDVNGEKFHLIVE